MNTIENNEKANDRQQQHLLTFFAFAKKKGFE
jgi:hypothetical protein